MPRLMKLVRSADQKLSPSRRTPRRILINARRAMNYSIVAPIHRAMQSDPRVRFYLTASEDPSQAREIYREAPPDCEIISPLKASAARFDIYLVADVLWLPMLRSTCRVLMFHGVAGKYSSVYDSPAQSMREWDRIFFINRRRQLNFVKSGAIEADSNAARLIGMPKLDCLADGSLRRNDILAGLGLDTEKPTVLYAPTWSAKSSLNSMGEEIVRNLGEAGYTVLVKLHDGSLMKGEFFSGGIDWITRLQPLLESYNGYLATESDACPLMAAADALVTDHSSIGFEYLLLDRPVIRIHVPDLLSSTNVGAEYVRLLSDAATSITEPSQVAQAVDAGLRESISMSDIRRRTAEELFYQAGSATNRAVAELYSLLNLTEYARAQNTGS